MKITTGTLMKLIGEVEAILSREGVLDAEGNFANPVSPEALAKAAADIEVLLKTKGVVIQGKVDQAIQALPLVLGLIGLG